MARQQPEKFPPAYHDLAMAHHEAAEELGRVMPTHDLKQILPKLDGLLSLCRLPFGISSIRRMIAVAR